MAVELPCPLSALAIQVEMVPKVLPEEMMSTSNSWPRDEPILHQPQQILPKEIALSADKTHAVGRGSSQAIVKMAMQPPSAYALWSLKDLVSNSIWQNYPLTGDTEQVNLLSEPRLSCL